MPETDKREEGEELPKESSDSHASASGEEEMDAAAAARRLPAAGDAAQEEEEVTVHEEAPVHEEVPVHEEAPVLEEVPVHEAEIVSDGSAGEFADSVVSGLEQAARAIHRNGAADFYPELRDLDLDQMSDVFFAGWAEPEDPHPEESSGKAEGTPINLHAVSLTSLGSSTTWEGPASPAELEAPSRALHELSQLDLVSLSSSEGAEQPQVEEQPEVLPSSLSELSDMGLASWGASEGVEQTEPPLELELEPELEPKPELQSLGTLGGIELASATGFAAFQASSGDMGKHDELADAVQSALLSIYGEQTARPLGTVFQKAIPAEKDPASPVWNKGPSPVSDSLSPQDVILNYFDYTSEDRDAGAAAAGFASDRLTPQEVILNYFDYPNPQSGNGSQRADYEPASNLPGEEPITLRPRTEPGAAFRRARPAQERPVQRQEWTEASTQPGHYSGPPSFPVPAAGHAAASKPRATPGEESSRLLGAAAIGLMGGIAIAASLAAFLIYGPHPATIEIPGIGNLRLDKDEQGYGRTITIPEESPREPLRSTAATAPAEFSGEIFAADAVAVPGQPAPLSIGIRSQLPVEKTLVAIQGIPEGGRLSAGVDAGGGSWLVPPKRLNGLTISLPAGLPGTISLEAQLLDSNARTPVSPRGTFAVRLVSAADTGQTAPAFAPTQAPQPPSGYSFTTQTLSPPAAATDRTAGAQPPAADASFKAQTVVTSPPQRSAAAAVPQAAPGDASAARRAGRRPEVEVLIR